MASTGFFDFIDDTLEKAYQYVAPDHTAHRKPFVKGLKRVIETFEGGRQPRGDSAMWSASNNVVRFIPKIANRQVMLKEGKPVYYVPAERFVDAVKNLIEEVEAGKHDDALAKAKDAGSKGETDTRGVGTVRAGWTAERRARYEATQAAKKAQKG